MKYLLPLLVVWTLVLNGCSGEKESDEIVKSDQNEKLAHRFHMDIFQEGKMDVADEILSPNFVNHFPGNPPEMQRGPDGMKRLAVALRTAFPDMQIIHDDVITQGDKVIIRWSMTGTQDGELFGVPPTGKSVSITGIDIFRVDAGKIVELWQNWDQMGMMQQLGVIPAAEESGE